MEKTNLLLILFFGVVNGIISFWLYLRLRKIKYYIKEIDDEFDRIQINRNKLTELATATTNLVCELHSDVKVVKSGITRDNKNLTKVIESIKNVAEIQDKQIKELYNKDKSFRLLFAKDVDEIKKDVAENRRVIKLKGIEVNEPPAFEVDEVYKLKNHCSLVRYERNFDKTSKFTEFCEDDEFRFIQDSSFEGKGWFECLNDLGFCYLVNYDELYK